MVPSTLLSVVVVTLIPPALHDLDPVFDAFTRQKAFARIAEILGCKDPRLLQSMYIFKVCLFCSGIAFNYRTHRCSLLSNPELVVKLSRTKMERSYTQSPCLVLATGFLWSLPQRRMGACG